MRIPRILAGAVVGVVVLGAVVGSAATLGNTVPAMGADTASIASCDTAVTTAWETAYDATLGAYEVTNVTIGALDGTPCAGATLKVTLTGAAGASLGEKTASAIISTDTNKVVDFSADNISAESAQSVSVVLVGP